jgi:hypothetical protein
MGPSGSQTQRTEPPKYQLPFLQYGVQQARSLYDQGQGAHVAPFNADQVYGMSATRELAKDNPITGAAGNLAQQTLSGGFLGSNPWLDRTFEQARLATQGGLSSEFARSGRNVDQSIGLRSQQLDNLATNIYGGAYDAERNRQQQVLGMSPMLGQAQYADFDRLFGIGSQQQQLDQQRLEGPGNALDDYLNRISGNMGTTIKTSQSGNNGAGILGGLGLLGSMLTLSDAREKKEIKHLGSLADLGIYEFSYKSDKQHVRHVGLMAQEVELKYPDAVYHDEHGRKYVMYDIVFDRLAAEGMTQ